MFLFAESIEEKKIHLKCFAVNLMFHLAISSEAGNA